MEPCLYRIAGFLLLGRWLFGAAAPRLVRTNASKIAEEAWALAGSMALAGLGLRSVTREGSRCTLIEASGCLGGFPAHAMDPTERSYYMAEESWYLFMILRGITGLGHGDRGPMAAHHLLSVSLLLGSSALRLHRLGCLILVLLALTNPLLHLSKLLSAFDRKAARTVVFALFGAVFLATRVVFFPLLLARCLPEAVGLARQVGGLLGWGSLISFYSGLGALFGLQVYWMVAIAKLLVQAAFRGSDHAVQTARQSYDTLQRVRVLTGGPMPPRSQGLQSRMHAQGGRVDSEVETESSPPSGPEKEGEWMLARSLRRRTSVGIKEH